MSSLQQLSNARANLLLFSSNFLTPERILLLFSSDFLRQSDSSSLLQRFPTPERFFFSSPAISYARAILLLFSFHTSEISFVFTFLVVWMMPSPYSPSSFTLQSPDCSGIFLPDAFLSRFHGNHFSPGVILRTFCRTFSLHRLFLLVLRRLSLFQADEITILELKGILRVSTISDLVLYLAFFSLFKTTPPPARRIFFSPHGALAFELMSA